MNKLVSTIGLIAILGTFSASGALAQNAGGGAMAKGQAAPAADNMSAGKPMGGADAKGQMCPDGTPMPPKGVCPAPKANAKASGAASANRPATPAGDASGNAMAKGSTPAGGNDTNAGATTPPKGTAPAQAGANSAGKPAAPVNVTDDQKSTIRQSIQAAHVAPITINVEINIGVAIPRETHLQPVPDEILRVVPAYSGFLFFVLADGRIVIVDPNTYLIVLVI